MESAGKNLDFRGDLEIPYMKTNTKQMTTRKTKHKFQKLVSITRSQTP